MELIVGKYIEGVYEVELGDFKERWTGIQVCQYYIDNYWPIPSSFTIYISLFNQKSDQNLNYYIYFYTNNIKLNTTHLYLNTTHLHLNTTHLYLNTTHLYLILPIYI